MARSPFTAVGHGAKTLANAAKRLFIKEDPAVAPQPPAYWDDERLSLSLGNILQETETKASGRVQVITLTEFSDAIGPLWKDYKDRVVLIAESTIGRMIGRGNTYIPQHDDSWLLLFTACKEDEAIERAATIAARIGEKLMGERFVETEPPLPEAEKVDLTGALNADGSLNLEAIRRSVNKARTRHRPPPPKEAQKPAIEERADRRAARLAARSVAGDLHVLYLPAWSADTQSVDSVFFRAFAATGDDVYAGADPPNDATAMDLVQTAVRSFMAICTAGARLKFSLPVPFPIIDGADLPDFQRMIAAIRQQDRLLQLRIEITHVPTLARAEDLVRARELLRGYVRDVAFHLDLFSPHDQVLALDHIVLGAELSRNASEGNSDDLRAAMQHFRSRAGKRVTYLLGLRSRSQLAAALQAGFDEVGGSVLSESLKRPPERSVIVRREEMLKP